MRSRHTVPLAILFGGLVIAGALYFSFSTSTPETTHGDPSLVRPVGSADHILGNPDAPVTIVTYTDYECAYCRQFHNTLTRVVADYGSTGKVAVVYRQFPLTELYENSRKHALAAECVALTGGNEAFWRFSHLLFTHQPVAPSAYGSRALEAGAAATSFQDCYSTAEANVGVRVDADRENALSAGARGTPYSLIIVDGRPPVVMDGAYTYDAVTLLLDTALANL